MLYEFKIRSPEYSELNSTSFKVKNLSRHTVDQMIIIECFLFLKLQSQKQSKKISFDEIFMLFPRIKLNLDSISTIFYKRTYLLKEV